MPLDATRANRGFELINVSKFFGDLAALRNVCLRIEPRESVFLYGANGAGKTTLLRTLAALSRASEGEVRFDGQKFEEQPRTAKAAIGFVSHATFLYGELTARENLQFVGKLFGLSSLEEKIDRALDLFSVRDRGHEPVRQLSRGLQQRVSLARAFLHNPDFVLLDEPFTGLDQAAMDNLQDLLRRLPEQGKALIFSAHDFERGAAIARRLVVLEKGSVKYDGELRHAPLEELGIRREVGSRQ
ncbi:MAG: heme ABC exporter ATP-binding protein CcmA [Terriglobia bacterium]|jgi:heme exporter protein A